MPRQRLSSTGVTEHLVGMLGSLRLDASGLDYLGPLLSFFGDQLAKVGGRPRKHRAAKIGKPRLEFGIDKASVDFLVELRDDFGGRVLGRANAIP